MKWLTQHLGRDAQGHLASSTTKSRGLVSCVSFAVRSHLLCRKAWEDLAGKTSAFVVGEFACKLSDQVLRKPKAVFDMNATAAKGKGAGGKRAASALQGAGTSSYTHSNKQARTGEETQNLKCYKCGKYGYVRAQCRN